MATIYSSYDKHPVYIDSNGNPLAFGKLYYYMIGGSTTQKTIYTDVGLTVTGSNPQLLDGSGRTNTQIFLGDGEYTVVAYKFNGVDPVTADPSEWSIDNQWDESGAIAVTTTGILFTVDTISDLRNVDPLEHTNVDVLGYYDTKDCFTRNYRWISDVVVADNGGTIIRNPDISVGAFVLQNADNIMDVRVFGAMPNKTTIFCNSPLASASSWCNSATNTATTLFFPAGNYYVTTGSLSSNVPVEFDRAVTFNVRASGNYIITFNNKFIYNNNASLTFSASLGTVLPRMQWTGSDYDTIYPMWWAGTGNLIDNGASTWKLMTDNSLPNYVIAVIGQTSIIQNVGAIWVKQRMRQVFSGFIFLGAGSSLQLGASIELTGNHGFFLGNLANIQANGYNILYTSMFLPCNYTSPQTQTSDLGAVLTQLQSTFGFGTMIYDCPVNQFATKYVDNGIIKHVYKAGVITGNFSDTFTNYVKYQDISGLTHGSLEGAITIQNGVTHLGWFNMTDATAGWQNAAQCAIRGNGTLDMGGKTITIGQIALNKSNQVNAQNIEIRNGYFNMTDTQACAIYFGGLFAETVRLTNIKITGSDYPLGQEGQTINGSGVPCNIDNLIIDGLSVEADAPDGGGSFYYKTDGVVDRCTIVNSNIKTGNLAHNCSGTEFVISNSTLAMALSADFLHLSNCRVGVLGTRKTHTIKCTYDNILTGNTFYDSLVNLVAGAYEVDFDHTSGSISWTHNVTGNSWYRSIDEHCGIYFSAEASGAFFSGAVVEGNSFVSRMAAHTGEGIYLWITDDGNCAGGTAMHVIKITGNSSSYGTVSETAGTSLFTVHCTGTDIYGSILTLDLDSTSRIFAPNNTTPVVMWTGSHFASADQAVWENGGAVKSYQPASISPNPGEERKWTFRIPYGSLVVNDVYNFISTFNLFNR